MTGLIITIIVVVLVGFGLRYLRAREIAKFRDADMLDFQAFKQSQQAAPDPLEARAEAYASLNPNVVALKQPDTSDEEADWSVNVPDATLFARKPAAFDDVTRNLINKIIQVLPEHLTIVRDVPLGEFVRVEKAEKSTNDPGYKLSVTKIDYLVCDLPSLNPVCGITLTDGQQGYDFIRGVFGDIGMPLLQFPATSSLSEVEIRDQLDPVLLTQESRSCPKCNERMTIRRVVKGAKAGRVFWVCTRFPGCRGVIQA